MKNDYSKSKIHFQNYSKRKQQRESPLNGVIANTISGTKLEEKEKIVYSCISYDPVHEELLAKHVFEAINLCVGTLEEVNEYNKDELNILNNMDESDIHLSLLTLEIKGLIVKKSGCYYARSEV